MEITPKIIEHPQILVIGVPFYGSPDNGQFAKVWDLSNKINAHIPHQREPATYYGVEAYPEKFRTEGKWFYLAGVEVTSLEAIPVQLVGKVLPAHQYAVFTHHGALPGKLHATFQYAYQTWLPQSSYVQAAPYDFERYDARFLGADNEQSVMEVWIPIILAAEKA